MIRYCSIVLLFLVTFSVNAQNPFEAEVKKLVAKDSVVNHRKLILFTGSSSIRLWKSLESDLAEYNTLNRGFGGSTMSDLIYYFDKLILPYQAKQIFIYEGDNDLAAGKSPDQILQEADSLLTLIRTKYSKRVRVVFITPKPSVARWKMKDDYVRFNAMLKQWASDKRRVEVADVWSALTDSNGVVLQDIFVEDNLHLNTKGYALWTAVIRKHISVR